MEDDEIEVIRDIKFMADREFAYVLKGVKLSYRESENGARFIVNMPGDVC